MKKKKPIESSCFWSESVMLSYVMCYHGYYSNFNGAANNNFIKSNDNMCTQRTICVESFHSYMLKSIFCKSGNSETRSPSFSFHTLHALCNFLLELLWTKHINHTRETTLGSTWVYRYTLMFMFTMHSNSFSQIGPMFIYLGVCLKFPERWTL